MSNSRHLLKQVFEKIYQLLFGQCIFIVSFMLGGGVLSSLSALITVMEFFQASQDSLAIARFNLGDFIRKRVIHNLKTYLIPSLIWSAVMGMLTVNILFINRASALAFAIFLINGLIWALFLVIGIAFAYLSANYQQISLVDRLKNALAYVSAYLPEWLVMTILLIGSLLACWQVLPALFYLVGLAWLLKGYHFLMKQLCSGRHFGRWRDYWRREDI